MECWRPECWGRGEKPRWGFGGGEVGAFEETGFGVCSCRCEYHGQGGTGIEKVGAEEGEGTRRARQAPWTLGMLLPQH